MGLVLHLIGGLIAIVTGLIQIWRGLTNRVAALHRVLGKFYAAGVLIGSVGGLYLIWTISGQFTYRCGFIRAYWAVPLLFAEPPIQLRAMRCAGRDAHFP